MIGVIGAIFGACGMRYKGGRMRILIAGKKPKPEYPKRFKCTYCGSLLEADKADLNYIGAQYNSSVYEFYCPVCNEKRTVDYDMFIKDEGD